MFVIYRYRVVDIKVESEFQAMLKAREEHSSKLVPPLSYFPDRSFISYSFTIITKACDRPLPADSIPDRMWLLVQIPQPGFVSASTKAAGNHEYIVTQTWESKEAYEAWMNSQFRRISQPPQGVWQFKPANKYSVPEDFCPFTVDDGPDDE